MQQLILPTESETDEILRSSVCKRALDSRREYVDRVSLEAGSFSVAILLCFDPGWQCDMGCVFIADNTTDLQLTLEAAASKGEI